MRAQATTQQQTNPSRTLLTDMTICSHRKLAKTRFVDSFALKNGRECWLGEQLQRAALMLPSKWH